MCLACYVSHNLFYTRARNMHLTQNTTICSSYSCQCPSTPELLGMANPKADQGPAHIPDRPVIVPWHMLHRPVLHVRQCRWMMVPFPPRFAKCLSRLDPCPLLKKDR